MDGLAHANSSSNTTRSDGHADMTPAACTYTAVVLTAILYGDDRHGIFLPDLPSYESPDDAIPSYIERDMCYVELCTQRKLSDTPKIPPMDFTEWIYRELPAAMRKMNTEHAKVGQWLQQTSADLTRKPAGELTRSSHA